MTPIALQKVFPGPANAARKQRDRRRGSWAFAVGRRTRAEIEDVDKEKNEIK
jgi:hypothetical protein